MRGVSLLFASGLTALAAAAPPDTAALGTKASPAAFDASPVGLGPVFQMLFALAIVGVGIKFALPWIVKRFGGRITTDVNGTIRIEETASFPGGRLYVVEARGRTLLLGATPQNVSFLADLTVTDFEEALAQAETPARAEVPTRAAAPVEIPREPRTRTQDPRYTIPDLTGTQSSIQDALARLERLGG